MAPDRRTEAWVRLSLVPGSGGKTLRSLLAACGGPEEVLAASRGLVARIAGEAAAARLQAGPDPAQVKATLAWAQLPGHHLVALDDPRYPGQLLHIPDPPLLLYVRGRAELLARPALAIVGSRNATPQGLANAEAFAKALSDAGLTIVSGLALGIDAAAHRGGLAGASSSVAVTGTGLDRVYPARNRDLALALAEQGALVSEFPLGTPARAENFPRRNRLLSGLSRGCLVVEAALQSGSLITARLAADQGREVFAIPGSIHSPLSKGCHALIKQGAKLVETARDILEELGLQAAGIGPSLGLAPGSAAPGQAEASPLLAHLGFDPVDLDTLAQRSGRPPQELLAELVALELEGRIASLPGSRYQRIK
ncbi:MAG: DNA-processing protein DprA [Pseudomonadota bacterium]